MPNISSATRYLPQAKEGFSATVATTIAPGVTIVPLSTVSGYLNGDTVVLTIDPGLPNQQVFTGVIDTSGVRVTNVVWTEGGNVTHTIGATVTDYVTATHLNLITKGLKPAHNNKYFVNEYGAVGDGITDDTSAIQAAITAASTAGGGTVVFSKATYLISAALNMKSYVSLEGASDAYVTAKGTIIKQSSTTADTLYYTNAGSGLTNVEIKNVRLEGPGSGSGRGIAFLNGGGSSNPHINLSLRNLNISGFGGCGLEVQCVIVSVFERIVSQSNTGGGFYFNGGAAFAAPNTSLTVTACYANGITSGNGFNVRSTVYSTFNSCAADDCGTAYLIDTCNQITMNSCGSEWANPTTASPADGFKITGSNQITLTNPYTYQNKHYSFWVTGNSRNVALIGPSENTPISATSSLKTDSGSHAIIIGMDFTTGRSDSGNTSYLDDGSGGFTTGSTGYVYSNGTITSAGNFTMFGGELLHMTYPNTTWTVATNENVMLCDATSGSFVATLPTAVGREGQTYTLKKIDSTANTVTIATTSSQTIDGVTTQVLSTQYESITVVSNNANWFII